MRNDTLVLDADVDVVVDVVVVVVTPNASTSKTPLDPARAKQA
jgi:hypothetical protein